MAQRFPCPRCNRLLEQSGELAVGDTVCPVYQCDECLVPWEIGGETFEAAYTFAVGPDGQVFDPSE
jgi:hypothetical protein